MDNNTKSSFFSPQFILGSMIILIGVLFMLDNLDIMDAGTILRFWPAVLVVYGASKIAQSRHLQGQIFDWIAASIGVLMLLDRLDFINFRVWDWWPIILIIIGLNFLRGSLKQKKGLATHPFEDVSTDADAFIRNTAMLSGVRRIITSKEFQGGEITSIMGGCEIDLRDADMKGNEAQIEVNVVMGGVQLRVPLGWSVSVEATPIMGGVEDKTYVSKEGSTKKLIISGTVLMGGVEVKN